jgi:hypothetical protein
MNFGIRFGDAPPGFLQNKATEWETIVHTLAEKPTRRCRDGSRGVMDGDQS